jgi:hypothetical protein
MVFITLFLLFSQPKIKDTLVFDYFHLQILKGVESGKRADGHYYIGQTKFSAIVYNEKNKFLDSTTFLLTGDHTKYYSILLNDAGKKIMEGIWNFECFMGPYIKYFPNGKMEVKGYYSFEYGSEGCVKIGHWEYYKITGKLDYYEDYDENGCLIERVYNGKNISRKLPSKKRKSKF